MQKEQVFRASSYREVEHQVDEWLSANPHVDIVSTITAEEGNATEADYSFVTTMRYEDMEEAVG